MHDAGRCAWIDATPSSSQFRCFMPTYFALRRVVTDEDRAEAGNDAARAERRDTRAQRRP